MTKHAVDNTQNVIDSRDIIERLSELEDARAAAIEAATPVLDDDTPSTWTAKDGTVMADRGDYGEEDEAEYQTLKSLQEEASYSADWRYGETLIRDSYFEEYAQELAEDIGAINKAASWPNNCIDWEKAADQLKQDYSSVDFDGVEYWIRS